MDIINMLGWVEKSDVADIRVPPDTRNVQVNKRESDSGDILWWNETKKYEERARQPLKEVQN
jgi:hypothetical protein